MPRRSDANRLRMITITDRTNPQSSKSINIIIIMLIQQQKLFSSDPLASFESITLYVIRTLSNHRYFTTSSFSTFFASSFRRQKSFDHLFDEPPFCTRSNAPSCTTTSFIDSAHRRHHHRKKSTTPYRVARHGHDPILSKPAS